MSLIDLTDCVPETNNEMLVAGGGLGEAQQVLDLVENNQDRRPQRESDDDRMRNVAIEVTQPKQRNHNLDGPHQECQHNRQLDRVVVGKCHEGTQRRR